MFKWSEHPLQWTNRHIDEEGNKEGVAHASDFQRDFFEPSGSIKLSGQRPLSDNGQMQFPEGVDWLIWGTDGEGRPKLSTLRDGKWTLLDDVPGFAIPKAVVVNNDSCYVMFLYRHSVDPTDVKASLQKILGYLKDEKLLNDYTVSPIKERQRMELEAAAKKAAEAVRPPPPPPTPEELARREWMRANPPVDDLFTAEEMAALFTEPDYGAIRDLHERGMAYDWHLKFTEAEKCFREDGSLKSKFMLGRYYKYGRGGIRADRWKANGMFHEIIRHVTEESKSPTAAELCLAGRACWEMGMTRLGIEAREREAFRRQAAGLFEAAEKQGHKGARLYPLYYGYMLDDYVNAREWPAMTDLILTGADVDLELLVAAAGRLQLSHGGRDYQPQKVENLAILKRGIQARLPLAEYFAGRLFDQGSMSHSGAALNKNPDRAKFWLIRAAKRGDDRAALGVRSRRYDGLRNAYSSFTDEELQ